MQQHGYFINHVQQKKQDSTNTCNARFHLHKVQKQKNTIYGVKIQKAGGIMPKRSHKWNSWDDVKVLSFWSGF